LRDALAVRRNGIADLAITPGEPAGAAKAAASKDEGQVGNGRTSGAPDAASKPPPRPKPKANLSLVGYNAAPPRVRAQSTFEDVSHRAAMLGSGKASIASERLLTKQLEWAVQTAEVPSVVQAAEVPSTRGAHQRDAQAVEHGKRRRTATDAGYSGHGQPSRLPGSPNVSDDGSVPSIGEGIPSAADGQPGGKSGKEATVLAAGWQRHHSKKHGRDFWYHKATHRREWKLENIVLEGDGDGIAARRTGQKSEGKPLWKACYSSKRQRTFYMNRQTKERVWHKPDGYISDDEK